MDALIQVFRMTEIPAEARVKVIIKLGRAINDQYGANMTEGLVLELVKILCPRHEITRDIHYLKVAGEIT